MWRSLAPIHSGNIGVVSLHFRMRLVSLWVALGAFCFNVTFLVKLVLASVLVFNYNLVYSSPFTSYFQSPAWSGLQYQDHELANFLQSIGGVSLPSITA